MEKLGNTKIYSQDNLKGTRLLLCSFGAADSLAGQGAAVLGDGAVLCPLASSAVALGMRSWPRLSTWLCGEDLGCSREVPHCWPDWWFGGEKCTLHLHGIILAISSMIFPSDCWILLRIIISGILSLCYWKTINMENKPCSLWAHRSFWSGPACVRVT